MQPSCSKQKVMINGELPKRGALGYSYCFCAQFFMVTFCGKVRDGGLDNTVPSSGNISFLLRWISRIWREIEGIESWKETN
ncbi:hypothetical protein CEXT_241731 [Caerostris extrusa]|uniref:Uncharacterized protein n=1 Tax=Caerostris extrusa TaxID=172846 RepID=A0AAV4TG73_CAEEX|nr:hypothetical protein CEXT_241731 [Caerostris extrusa]